jgi:hypothetical protein
MSFINLGRNRIWITEIKLYHLHLIQIAKAILNHKQDDTQNMEQSVDILKSESYDKTPILLQFASILHILVLSNSGL